MKEVRKDDLAHIHGGSDAPTTIGDTLPYPVVPMPTAAIPSGGQLPPTLPEKHVEA